MWGLDLSGSLQGAGGVGGLLKAGSLYPTYDANGNIMQKLDGNGVTVMNVAYDLLGNIISGTLVGEYGFSTKPLIGNLDWYYYGYRYYDPVTGRWPNRDPIEERGGLNLYAMVRNDLVNLWDLLGNMPCDQCPPCQIEQTRYDNANNRLDAAAAIYRVTQSSVTDASNAVNATKSSVLKAVLDVGFAARDVASACTSRDDDGDGVTDEGTGSSSVGCQLAQANLVAAYSNLRNSRSARDIANLQFELTLTYFQQVQAKYADSLDEFHTALGVLTLCQSDRLACLADCCP